MKFCSVFFLKGLIKSVEDMSTLKQAFLLEEVEKDGDSPCSSPDLWPCPGDQKSLHYPSPALGASPVTDLPQAVIQGSHFFLGGHRCCLPCKIPPQQPRTQGTALGGA